MVSVEHARSALFGLDPRACVMWLATVDDRPAGCTALYLRDLACNEQETSLPIGYWAHLFVLPEHRRRMLYPQLVLTMRRAMPELGIEAILTAMRRPSVTEAHLKLGFRSVCTWPVRLKPFRPAALVAKHKGLPLLRPLSPLIDGPWSVGLGMLRPRADDRVQLHEAASLRGNAGFLDEACDLLASVRGQRCASRWTPERLADRLGEGVDGRPYRIACIRQDGRLDGLAIFRTAVRGNGVRTGVLLELAARDDRADLLSPLAVACERELVRQRAEAVLWLDGAGQRHTKLLSALGYRPAPGETYRLIALTSKPAKALLPEDALRWRFTFLDHDAF
ncbi:MAG: hypothetical protein KatS3mg103_0323 [Phycisphaerales bacterium]|nr:MAG: hypothetical protein KatS3mg103_0323 [Phycisphaerales bacterium]